MSDLNQLIFQLKHLRGIGNKGLLRILQYFMNNPEKEVTAECCLKIGRIKKNYHSTFLDSFEQAMTFTDDYYFDSLERFSFLTILDDAYPEYLREIYNPPIALFYQGNISFLDTPTLGMIGSRKSTSYGKEMIDYLMPELCEKGITIVSGLARGNDTSAHQASIRNHGKTIAVIGCGLNCYYPKENQRLQEFIAKQHLIISEYLPNTKPLAYHFPSRNRIIAGISQGVCVVEAKKKSGTYITAQLALEEGREVYAIPGNPLSDQSEGCLHLIQEGAKCVWRPEDILEDWCFKK